MSREGKLPANRENVRCVSVCTVSVDCKNDSRNGGGRKYRYIRICICFVNIAV